MNEIIPVHGRPESEVTTEKSVVSARQSSRETRPPRRHDFDALRAAAMLLGIVLHASLAYTTRGSHAVRDGQTHYCFDILSTAVHGFRMPLFFSISGFFTAMLWRDRGLAATFKQRALRILVPLALFILPITWLNSKAISLFDAIDQCARAVAAAAAGAQADGRAPLGWHAEIINHSERREDSAPAGDVLARWGLKERVAGWLKPMMEKMAAESGPNAVSDLLKEKEGMSPGEPQASGAEEKASQGEFGPITRAYLELTKAPLFSRFQILGHLWFLWFLCLLLIPFGVYAWVAGRLGWGGAWSALFQSPRLLLWLVPLTMIPQWFHGLAVPDFGPDTSMGVFPAPHILLLYAVYFFFGVLYFDGKDVDVKLGRRWWLMLPIALLLVYPPAMDLTFDPRSGWISRWISHGAVRPLAVLLRVVYTWLMIFGLMGLFNRLFSTENKAVRYLSDSAYFLYLMHVPLLFAPQYLLKWVHLPVVFKFAVVCIFTTAILLLVYRYGIRYTLVGTMLNGRRTRPVKRSALPADPQA